MGQLCVRRTVLGTSVLPGFLQCRLGRFCSRPQTRRIVAGDCCSNNRLLGTPYSGRSGFAPRVLLHSGHVIDLVVPRRNRCSWTSAFSRFSVAPATAGVSCGNLGARDSRRWGSIRLVDNKHQYDFIRSIVVRSCCSTASRAISLKRKTRVADTCGCLACVRSANRRSGRQHRRLEMGSTELVVAVKCSAPSNVWQGIHGPQFTVRIENAITVVRVRPAG